MRLKLRSVILLALGLVTGALAAGVIVLYAGFYNVAATHQHFRPTFWLLKTGLRESVERHARGIHVPTLTDPALAQRGLDLYSVQCVQCHGAPGIAPQPFALGLTPVPTNLAHSVRERSSAELYWVLKNGIKMTGMPAWEFRLSEPDLWSVVAFLRELPYLAPEQYVSRVNALRSEPDVNRSQTPISSAGSKFVSDPNVQPAAPGDAERGKRAIEQYACVTCHRIPGIVGAHAPVGPPLERIATRQLIAGFIANTPENMVRWLREPQTMHPRTAMPDLGVTARDASDIAAYLYTLR